MTAPYEGDGHLSYDLKTIERQARAMRAAVIYELATSFYKKVVRWFERQSYLERDRYLNQATDLADLENRLKRLERQRSFI